MITSSGPARDLTRLSERRLRRFLKPLKTSNVGKGRHVSLNMVDLTALLYASRLQEAGLGQPTIREALEYFATLSPEKMLDEFRKGRVCLLPVRGHMKLRRLPSKDLKGTAIDVEASYKEMLESVRNYAEEHPKSKRGRGRVRIFDAGKEAKWPTKK